ncbi:MAG: hypothetical protein HN337_07785 [Deltaproteobacteria bacterium]|jgi:hypothetical protein|nr:hypothetical protein [Deltaproteobacteria bacterium]
MYNKSIIILADGTRADIFDELVAKGDLPNISKYLIEPGSKLPAVTTFPSTTGPAHLPFLTGCFPGTCNVPGIRWMDKAKYDAGAFFNSYRSYVGFESFCMASDMWPHIKTAFELIPNSYSIFNSIARGAKGRRNFTKISRIWYWYYGHLTDRWGFVDDMALKKLLQVLERDPAFVFTVFPATDVYAHLSYPHHERVIEQYRRMDGYVGKLVDTLVARGEMDTTAIFLVSDHGLSKTDKHFCVNTFLEDHDLPPFFYPLIFKKKGKLSANMVSGNAMTHLYFRNKDGWSRRTTVDELKSISPNIIDDLLEEAAVDIVSVRNGEGGADVYSRRGHARVRLDGSTLHYEVKGSDPFGYKKLQSDLSPELSLNKTWETEYPDAPFQIAHLLTSPRAGDLIISATPGFDLRVKYEHPEHFASHGSLHTSHMRVPIVSNVKFEERPVRTVDVFPTVLKLLGHDIPGHIDGEPL